MTAFVILAAGPGTRSGSELHKALLPLKGRAVISHQIALAPDARIIVVTGNRADQVKTYLDLAHPTLPVTFIHVDDWDQPGNGPGASLLAARNEVGLDGDMIFTSCDTLWEEDSSMWHTGSNWAATAPVPDGTKPERWTRVGPKGVFDKSEPGEGDAYTGLALVKSWDLKAFWTALEGAELSEGQKQVTAGLKALTAFDRLKPMPITWTDTGDAESYARAVVAMDGYDWSKPREATWVLPDEGRVVKWAADRDAAFKRMSRYESIAEAVPEPVTLRGNFSACKYVPGISGYAAASSDPDIVPKILNWAASDWQKRRVVLDITMERACDRFYRDKTADRMLMLRTRELRDSAWTSFRKINFSELWRRCEPVTFHGDFNLGNIIVGPDGKFTAVDWREDFAGELKWGDRRYDLGKFLAGLHVNWDYARGGDFQDWDAGEHHIEKFDAWFTDYRELHDVKVIAALSLISSAPLHKPPLDEILVAKSAEILEEVC